MSHARWSGVTGLWIIVCLLKFGDPVYAGPTKAAIASAHPLATQAGLNIIDAGGNAFDAAVTVSAVLAVVEPSGSGLGGGGFWLLHRESDGLQIMLDGRERAPYRASRDMFLDSRGRFDQKRAINGPLAAGIPGMPAAIVHLAEQYGKLSLKTSLEPAIRYAREGFDVGAGYLRLIEFRAPVIREYPAAAAIFLQQGRIPDEGFRLVQQDLAITLQQIAEQGRSGFYQGSVAKKLVDGVRAAGGVWSLLDLQDYRVVERAPIRSEYRGIQVTSASPPSSGGIVLAEALNILSGFELGQLSSIDRKHIVVEALRSAYFDRARYLGDPDYVPMPIEQLLSKEHADARRSGIRIDRAGGDRFQDKAGESVQTEGRNTTHFSIIDAEGNRVAATLSINYPFGSGFVAPGTGVLLNDEMDDFVGRPGSGNVYGLVGGAANSIEPGKRMLSSMTPTFLEDHDRVAILGTPGGSRIISMVLLGVLDFAEAKGPESWVSVPRFHHQYQPDAIQYEKGALNNNDLIALGRKGHQVKEIKRRYGNMQAILWDKKANRLTAASDPRQEGSAAVR